MNSFTKPVTPAPVDASQRQESPSIERLLRGHELAELLSLHPVTVRRKTAAGEIPSIRIGGVHRYRLSTVLESLEGGAR